MTPARRSVGSTRAIRQILVTTPESLYLILGSQARETLRTVETIILDEIHAIASTKRGTHLMLSLERVARRCRNGDPQRIGLSATARPTEGIARFLGGDRDVAIVDTSRPPALDLRVSVPVPDMTQPQVGGRTDPDDPGKPVRAVGEGEAETSLWPAIYPELLDLIHAHRSSILFVNNRALCERLAHRLNELAETDEEAPLVRAHHGRRARQAQGDRDRREGRAPCDRRHVESRARHRHGRRRTRVARRESRRGAAGPAADRARGARRRGDLRGVVFPKHRDLLEAAVVAKGMREGAVE